MSGLSFRLSSDRGAKMAELAEEQDTFIIEDLEDITVPGDTSVTILEDGTLIVSEPDDE